ncbi:MAG: aminotransferase class V-fold PLP-dependent enzyme [Pyrinomonadaceae bacterium]|nr:aminotransferase class V-fold PLP-dependent enzyme [Pyrinomonadaceae bacterium]
MSQPTKLMLDEEARAKLWSRLFEIIEDYMRHVHEARVSPVLDLEKIRALLAPFDFKSALEPLEAVERIVAGLWQYQVHTPHPRYFGLFNPAPTTASIAADTLVAAFNPQMAAWSHNPFAAEAERHLVRVFGERFGYAIEETDGTFCSGGAEANHTALLTALVHHFPAFSVEGARAIPAPPVFYVSSQSHHSFIKAARLCGLGTSAVREVELDENSAMSAERLASAIKADREQGRLPFMVIGTAGTTSAGVIDPLRAIAEVAIDEKLWFHVDAAWGGAAVLVEELRPFLEGIERADSITFDAHKWLSVPMGAGLYLTRHTKILEQTFSTAAGYMPRESREFGVHDPYDHSMQWSRRFIGLKVFLSLAVAGWEGYEAAIRHQTAMGALMREELEKSGWKVVNRTPLPVACFIDEKSNEGADPRYLEAIAREVVREGKTWISTTDMGHGRAVLRACVTNYRTEAEDVSALIEALNDARQHIARR